MASRRRFELPVSRMKSWRPRPLDERDIVALQNRTGDIDEAWGLFKLRNAQRRISAWISPVPVSTTKTRMQASCNAAGPLVTIVRWSPALWALRISHPPGSPRLSPCNSFAMLLFRSEEPTMPHTTAANASSMRMPKPITKFRNAPALIVPSRNRTAV